MAAAAALLTLAGISRLEGAERTVALYGAVCFAAAALIATGAIASRRTRWAYAATAGATTAFFFSCVLVLFPALGRAHSAEPLIRAVPALAREPHLFTVEVRVPSLVFYLDRPVPVLNMDQLGRRLERDEPSLFVMVDVDLPAVPDAAVRRLEEVGRHGKYVVFRKKEAAPPVPDAARPDAGGPTAHLDGPHVAG
jgi:hypothetical protein